MGDSPIAEKPSNAGPVTTILWDNDGVLVDTEGLYYQATREILADCGVDLTPYAYRRYHLTENRGSWHLAAMRGVPLEVIRDGRMRRNRRYAELLRERPLLIDGVRETFHALHDRYTMGIVTSSDADHFEIIHETTGLLDYISFTVTSADVKETKPSPEPYLRGLERAGARPDQAIVVEDSRRGLLAAQAAGIPCYVIPTDWTRTSDFTEAAGVLGSVQELPAIVYGMA